MRSSSIYWVVFGGLFVVLSGCTAARMVECDRDGGVVAIPNNTNMWPTYHRDTALKLIQEKCPNGYEIVRESETVTGQQTHTSARTDTEEAPTLMLGGSEGTSEKKKKGGERRSDAFGGLAVPLGETKQTTEGTTTTYDLTEYRISYKAKH